MSPRFTLGGLDQTLDPEDIRGDKVPFQEFYDDFVVDEDSADVPEGAATSVSGGDDVANLQDLDIFDETSEEQEESQHPEPPQPMCVDYDGGILCTLDLHERSPTTT